MATFTRKPSNYDVSTVARARVAVKLASRDVSSGFLSPMDFALVKAAAQITINRGTNLVAFPMRTTAIKKTK